MLYLRYMNTKLFSCKYSPTTGIEPWSSPYGQAGRLPDVARATLLIEQELIFYKLIFYNLYSR